MGSQNQIDSLIREVRSLFKELNSWRDESLREESLQHFSNIINYHSKNISEAIKVMKDQLSYMTKERDDLIATLDNLSSEVRNSRNNGPIARLSQESKENHGYHTQEVNGPDVEIPNTTKLDAEKSKDSLQNKDPDQCNDYRDIRDLSNWQQIQDPLKNQFKNSTAIFEEVIAKHGIDVKGNLKPHKESVSKMDNKRFKCKQCPFASVYKSGMRMHINKVHEKIKNHVCGECGYATFYKGCLKLHLESVHKIGGTKFKSEQSHDDKMIRL